MLRCLIRPVACRMQQTPQITNKKVDFPNQFVDQYIHTVVSTPMVWYGNWTQPMKGVPETHYYHWQFPGIGFHHLE